jgi:hypothetical protein
MRYGHKLLLEVLDEALRLLPPTVPSFTKLKTYESIPNLRRAKRVDAHGLKTRRSSHAGKKSPWVDIPPLAITKENG